MSDWKPYVDALHVSDGGRQMNAMLDKLDEKARAKRFAARVGRVAAALEPSQRELLEMVVFERKSRAEIMAELGIAERTLRQRVHDLEKKIQKSLGNIRRPPPVLG